MSLYRYVKTVPKRPMRLPVVIAYSFIWSGAAVILWVVWPILSFQITTTSLLSQTISPLPDWVNTSGRIGEVVQAADEISPLGNELLNANRWYPEKPQAKSSLPVDNYTISIPKLRIKDARVVIAGDSLDTSLIHYGGTSLPGQVGTPVIFGHSTLPQLYDPTNYKAIFSLLPTLKPKSDDYAGDEIFITYDGIMYRYVIYDMRIHKPTDLSVLEQQTDGSYVRLITCVPPGTLWARESIDAKLEPLL